MDGHVQAGNTGHRRTTQVTPSLHFFIFITHTKLFPVIQQSLDTHPKSKWSELTEITLASSHVNHLTTQMCTVQLHGTTNMQQLHTFTLQNWQDFICSYGCMLEARLQSTARTKREVEHARFFSLCGSMSLLPKPSAWTPFTWRIQPYMKWGRLAWRVTSSITFFGNGEYRPSR